MKAYNLYAVGDLRYEDANTPALKSGWALVKVKATGICSSDVPRIFTNGTYHFPTIPGHEFSGIVDKVFDDDNSYLVGKKVSVFPLIPCMKCESCKNEQYETCSNYDYIGSRRNGAFAEYVDVPVWNIIELPNNVSYEEGALLEPCAVALHAVKKANIKKNDNVLVIGTGLIGIVAARLAKIYGSSNVDVLGRNNNKKAIVEKMQGVNYITSAEDSKYDVVIEAVGSNQSITSSLSYAASNGRVVFLGNPSSDISLDKQTYWKILRKQLTVFGTWNSSYNYNKKSDWSEVANYISKGELNLRPLITQLFNQDQLFDALDLIRFNKEVNCKVVVSWNKGDDKNE